MTPPSKGPYLVACLTEPCAGIRARTPRLMAIVACDISQICSHQPSLANATVLTPEPCTRQILLIVATA